MWRATYFPPISLMSISHHIFCHVGFVFMDFCNLVCEIVTALVTNKQNYKAETQAPSPAIFRASISSLNLAMAALGREINTLTPSFFEG